MTLVAIAAAVLLLSGGSDDAPAVDPALAKVQNYHAKQYDAGVSSGWPQIAGDRPVGNFLESSWYDPASKEIQYIIDSAASDDAAAPMAMAELARAQARELKDYRERGLRWIKLRGNPVVRWAYDAGEFSRIEFFIEECGVSIVARGVIPKISYETFSRFYRGMAYTITAVCD